MPALYHWLRYTIFLMKNTTPFLHVEGPSEIIEQLIWQMEKLRARDKKGHIQGHDSESVMDPGLEGNVSTCKQPLLHRPTYNLQLYLHPNIFLSASLIFFLYSWVAC